MPSPKILLVDGYNAINRIPGLKPGAGEELEDARRKLALVVSAWRRSHPATECIIVFDGDRRYAGARELAMAGVRCLFTLAAHGGDAEIIRFVREKRQNAADIVVVSDDNNVRNNCRAHGASVQPTSFIAAERAPHPRGVGKPAAAGKRIGQKAAAEIDKELKKKFGL